MGDIELKIWQERQMERCLIENTINSVIEACSVFAAPSQPPQLARYYEPPENLEESAILMAISEHGLQQSAHPVQDLCVRQEHSGDIMEMDGESKNNNSNADIDDDSSSNSDHMNVVEAAVSLAIQKQGLSLLGPNR